jgi:GNAT superfamily N-acetyltransferase
VSRDVTLIPVSTGSGIAIRRLASVDDGQVEALADVLIDCIEGGAGISFMHPLAPAKAQAFWRRIADDVADGRRALLIAEDNDGIVGTVQLVLDQPENQPHRADLSKMLVHRRGRRQGLGAALMEAAEQMARDCGKTLLVLDTVTGSDAERLYERLGWVRVGTIPDYALQSRGGLASTTVFYKAL